MPTLSSAAAAVAVAVASAPSIFLRTPLPSSIHRTAPSPPFSLLHSQFSAPFVFRRPCFSCQVALTTDISSSSSSSEEQEAEEAAAAKVGKRVRVTVPLKVYHVSKAPELDLNGLEGVIKQYAAVWKGKSVSANLPFKVEFLIEVAGQPRPVKFAAHLKEDEFEFLPDN